MAGKYDDLLESFMNNSAKVYDEDKKNYRTENMYCSTVEKTVKRELKNGEMLYDEVTVNFIGNEKVNR